MQINLNNRRQPNRGDNPQKAAPTQMRKSVVISPNPTRVSEMLDMDGNVIDRRTKQIIRRNNEQE